MSEMFSGCNSLKSLPDISKWDISNVTDMRDMFNECNSLISLPDLSKWNISKVSKRDNIFNEIINNLNNNSEINFK